MIAQVIEQIGESARPKASEVPENVHDSSGVSVDEAKDEVSVQIASAQNATGESAAERLGDQVSVQSSKEDDAAQHDVTEESKKAKQLSYRAHGTALPR